MPLFQPDSGHSRGLRGAARRPLSNEEKTHLAELDVAIEDQRARVRRLSHQRGKIDWAEDALDDSTLNRHVHGDTHSRRHAHGDPNNQHHDIYTVKPGGARSLRGSGNTNPRHELAQAQDKLFQLEQERNSLANERQHHKQGKRSAPYKVTKRKPDLYAW